MMSQRDVVFTPFMLRVRETMSGTTDEDVTLHYETSRPTSIAVAVDEWFMLRARAEHVIAEANAMLDPGVERIALDDEYGTGRLAFVLRWSNRSYRLLVHEDVGARTGQVEMDGPTRVTDLVKPVDHAFLEDLAVALLDPRPPTVEIGETP
jgi:hypothetical protein